MFKPFNMLGVRQSFSIAGILRPDTVLGTKGSYRDSLAGDRVQKFSLRMAQSYKKKKPMIKKS